VKKNIKMCRKDTKFEGVKRINFFSDINVKSTLGLLAVEVSESHTDTRYG
jgi:hypothetical protein